jgi:hypothetical protein
MRGRMSIPRPSVREYAHASEDLMKIEDLTDAEMEAVQEMSGRVAEKFNLEDESKT